MTSFVSSSHHPSYCTLGGGARFHNQERLSSNKLPFSTSAHHHGRPSFGGLTSPAYKRSCRPVFATTVGNDDGDDNPEDGKEDDTSSKREAERAGRDAARENLERIVGRDDSKFSGMDLATLIRNKYGRSYDVQLIKKEFMGKNFLALNVMWKYTEQKSFPLTEEEYLLRLDDVANTLKCWGAVSHIRESLEKLKERPRIGKAVSIFIDMDETGGRANEWIYK